jgi:hypothetical protein
VAGTEGAAKVEVGGETAAGRAAKAALPRKAPAEDWEDWVEAWDAAASSIRAAGPPSPPGEGCPGRAAGGAAVMGRPARAEAYRVVSPEASGA